ncbi:MAG: type II secretion system protein GspK [Candidatus Contendobacter sp.]|nr:type II secretion system protein GspK [Candidatus Contendobacter sp.]MDG4558622.1 type II secretion system protein GspK [Candidatus Contendobacter sp.]
MNGVNLPERPAGQRGMVLVIVLWIVTLLAVMAGGFAYSMRVETRLATSAVERAQARALAEAGVAYGLAWQLDPEAQKQWPPNGDPREWTFGGGRVRIEVTNASGLINLNNAGFELLKALLAGVGVAPREQDRLANAIQDWRDPDDDRSLPYGAESADYRAAGWPKPKNANFESVEELGQVLGMTGELQQRLTSVTTVFSYESTVNPELAPARVLNALGLDERTATDYVAARTRAAADGLPAPPLSSNEGSSFFFGGRSSVYHIRAEAETDAGTAVRVEAVFDTQGGMAAGPGAFGASVFGGRGPRLLAWREGW